MTVGLRHKTVNEHFKRAQRQFQFQENLRLYAPGKTLSINTAQPQRLYPAVTRVIWLTINFKNILSTHKKTKYLGIFKLISILQNFKRYIHSNL